MMNRFVFGPVALMCVGVIGVVRMSAKEPTYIQLNISQGVIEGIESDDGAVRAFKGIPYAAPPVGPLRWKPPQPVAPWFGVRRAIEFAPRAMQVHVWDDMIFRDAGPSEDCLYLNVWTPAKSAGAKLPVMVWIHGGGWRAGSSSEPRQDGEELCKKGVVVVSMNYRMGIFGFFALPGLTAESEHHASGNYGLLDMVASLRWVRDNIAAFGGDPGNVTIFGESAGSSSVCALMASPLARGLFQKTVGESGSVLEGPAPTRQEAEKAGEALATKLFGTASVEKLRAIPAEELLEKTADITDYDADVDGYFFTRDPNEVYAAGDQAHVPLLAGWNLDENDYNGFLEGKKPTVENYAARVREEYGKNAARILELYPANSVSEVKRAAGDLAGDRFIGLETWKWIEEHTATGGAPVYRYHFEQRSPLPVDAPPDAEPRAAHSWDIEFVFRVLAAKKLPWRPEDYQVSELMASYWTNFAKRGDPNGPGLPEWPVYSKGDGYQIMHLKTDAKAAPDTTRARYEFLDSLKASQ